MEACAISNNETVDSVSHLLQVGCYLNFSILTVTTRQQYKQLETTKHLFNASQTIGVS